MSYEDKPIYPSDVENWASLKRDKGWSYEKISEFTGYPLEEVEELVSAHVVAKWNAGQLVRSETHSNQVAVLQDINRSLIAIETAILGADTPSLPDIEPSFLDTELSR